MIGLPTAEACHVAVQRTAVGAAPLWRHMLERQPEGGRVATLRVVSLRADATNRAPTFDINLAELRAADAATSRITYAAARALFAGDAARAWAAYVVGCVVVLEREAGADLASGRTTSRSSSTRTSRRAPASRRRRRSRWRR